MRQSGWNWIRTRSVWINADRTRYSLGTQDTAFATTIIYSSQVYDAPKACLRRAQGVFWTMIVWNRENLWHTVYEVALLQWRWAFLVRMRLINVDMNLHRLCSVGNDYKLGCIELVSSHLCKTTTYLVVQIYVELNCGWRSVMTNFDGLWIPRYVCPDGKLQRVVETEAIAYTYVCTNEKLLWLLACQFASALIVTYSKLTTQVCVHARLSVMMKNYIVCMRTGLGETMF